jgi:cytochrome c553
VPIERVKRSWIPILIAAALMLVVAGASLVVAGEFEDNLKRVDHALQTNPNHVHDLARHSCLHRRGYAAQLFYAGHTTRAERSLKYCYSLLQIPEKAPKPQKTKDEISAERIARIQARAAREYDRAISLAPDIGNGLRIYRECAECHMPEGWGLPSGIVPQIAGQHRTVVIKQLADIRAGNRANHLMMPYASVEAIGGAQAVSDVAGYIDTLEISVENGKGPGTNLDLGARLYAENCAQCHGAEGEGDSDRHMPRIQAQHYNYLVAQFQHIRDGKRRNSDPAMVEQIKTIDEAEMLAVLDFVSRLEPPEVFQAPPEWRNPDFADNRPVLGDALLR